MKQTKFIVSFLVSFLCLNLVLPAVYAEPSNLSLVKEKILVYYTKGGYQRELDQHIARAREYIDQRASQAKAEKLAIVLDIDETSLSNVKRIVRENFSANPEKIKRGILAANSPAIKPMLSLYNDAKSKSIAIFFVTGRPESFRKATQLNLLKAGYKNWAGLYLRPEIYNIPTIIDFKSKTRKMIEKKGYKIIASIGDQESDLKGGYAEKVFKLPNPFYYLP